MRREDVKESDRAKQRNRFTNGEKCGKIPVVKRMAKARLRDAGRKRKKGGGEMVVVPEKCELCPRRCGVDRNRAVGRCGVGGRVKVARAALHFWEAYYHNPA